MDRRHPSGGSPGFAVNHTVAELDQWENAVCTEEAAREKAKTAKKEYEDALRQEFFNF